MGGGISPLMILVVVGGLIVLGVIAVGVVLATRKPKRPTCGPPPGYPPQQPPYPPNQDPYGQPSNSWQQQGPYGQYPHQ